MAEDKLNSTYLDPWDGKMTPVTFENKALPTRLAEQTIRTPGRIPSPQPAHFSLPSHNGNGNGNGHKVLRSATVGYIAPPFDGKQKQMEEGENAYMRNRLSTDC